MFRFFTGKVQRWRAKVQREELVYYVDMLKGAEIEARAMVVAAATDFRNVMMESPEYLKERAAGTEDARLHVFDELEEARRTIAPRGDLLRERRSGHGNSTREWG